MELLLLPQKTDNSASSSLISSVKLACTSILDDMIICKFFIIVSAALHLPISSPVVPRQEKPVTLRESKRQGWKGVGSCRKIDGTGNMVGEAE